MAKSKSKPNTAIQRIMRVADLPQERDKAPYEISNAGEKPKVAILQKRQRQIVDLLINGPVYCASPVRISDVVHILKREVGLRVDTTMYPGNPETGAGDYGIYTLISTVRRVDDVEVAA